MTKEVFRAFLKLGCTAFGGPVAHLGFFREEFVEKRKWLAEEAYADLVALCQFLPGPASSQVGFAIGLKRSGLAGAFAAWVAFTLPSAVLMIGFYFGLELLEDLGAAGWVAGVKLAAVAVVANALWSMAAQLCPDRPRALLALAAAAFLVVVPSPVGQVAVILLGMAAGGLIYRQRNPNACSQEHKVQPNKGWPWLSAFILLLFGLPIASQICPEGWLLMTEGFYRAGSLVFGGGHVVLPLLDSFTVGKGWVSQDEFLAGYGAAQALPGPLFSFSAFLGASLQIGPGGITGGLLALIAIYLPSWLLVLGALPYWERLRQIPAAQAALMGANAAVVGLLLAAFYDPIWRETVTGPIQFSFALVGFALLRFGNLPPWALVMLCGAAGQLLT